ncbi:replication-relaxation family protein [Catenulispora sp. NL8]|uniref:Replication-relaxation family protein n=1 Tax=Catenulispora pinistramenti TaxID=2705254 RepID=A0ABS5KGT3_9ACTN|nr:replication-relaxation family protein [Catenulispora pinistramenti]MBS2545521.1 replication-relaxation family protein [Catenulispora pinistramenti]
MTTTSSGAADRITARDARMLRLIAEHRVLTSSQLTTAFFNHSSKARLRIGILREAELIETFRPPGGDSVLHCVATAKALKLLGVSRSAMPPAGKTQAATAAALRPDLGHLRGVNEFFCQLIARSRRIRGAALEEWRSEWTTAALFPARVRPDGFARWRVGEQWCEFFFEYDTGSEPLHRLVAKLNGYDDLMHTADTCCPVLFWLPNARREQHVHQALGAANAEVPFATAAGDPEQADVAGSVWRPVFADRRLTLAELGAAACAHLGVPHQPHAL